MDVRLPLLAPSRQYICPADRTTGWGKCQLVIHAPSRHRNLPSHHQVLGERPRDDGFNAHFRAGFGAKPGDEGRIGLRSMENCGETNETNRGNVLSATAFEDLHDDPPW